MANAFDKGKSLNSYAYSHPKSIVLQEINGPRKYEFISMKTGLKLKTTHIEDSEQTDNCVTVDMFPSSGQYTKVFICRIF